MLYYADDAQIYGNCKPGEPDALRVKMLDCINDVNNWMASNRLKLNPTKTGNQFTTKAGVGSFINFNLYGARRPR